MEESAKNPWHLWVIGILALLWNAGGAFDYVMTQTKNADYLAQMTPEQLAIFENFPAWAVAVWAIAVWFSVLGAILLLLRSRHAVLVFFIALVALVISTLRSIFISNIAEIMGPTALIFSAVIFVVGVLLWLYARTMAQRGVLR